MSVWLEGQERKEIRRKRVEIRGMKIRRRNANRHTENGFCNCQCALIKSPASKGLDLRSDRNTRICFQELFSSYTSGFKRQEK